METHQHERDTPLPPTSGSQCGLCGGEWPCNNCFPVRLLGSGTYGEVWEAKLRNQKHNVALKVMTVDPDCGDAPIVDVTCLQEVRTIHSKHIMQPLDAWLQPSTHTMSVAMPLAVCDLAHYIRHCEDMTLGSIAHVASTMVCGLADMHRQQLMHRDVTVGNVVFMDDGRPLLCDRSTIRPLWGLSQLRSTYSPRVTTQFYAAPEMLAAECHPGVAKYDQRVDVWAVGCVVMEMLLDQPLFEFKEGDVMRQLAAALRVDAEQEAWPQSSTPLTATQQVQLSSASRMRRLNVEFDTVQHMVQNHWHPVTSELQHAIDFCAACLRVDPNKRPTAAALTQHPFCATKRPQDTRAAVQALATSTANRTKCCRHRCMDKRFQQCVVVNAKVVAVMWRNATRGAVRLPFARHTSNEEETVPPPTAQLASRTALSRVMTRCSQRLAMAELAARWMWPAPRSTHAQHAAGWCSFAAAMCLFDGLSAAVDPTPLHLQACCMLASMRSASLDSVRFRMTPAERACVRSPRFRNACTEVVCAVQCATAHRTVVDDVLSMPSPPPGGAALVAAALASMSLQWVRWRDTKACLEFCEQHRVAITTTFTCVYHHDYAPQQDETQ